jgi:zinc finger protein
MSDNANLFPTLGEIATRTDARADVPEGQVGDEEHEDEDRDMQEIESLCMRCHEQVSCCDHTTETLACP